MTTPPRDPISRTWPGLERHRLRWTSLPAMAGLVLAGGTVGVLVAVPPLLPWLLAAPLLPPLLLDLTAAQPRRALLRVACWALTVAALAGAVSLAAPRALERAVPEAQFRAWEAGRLADGGRGLVLRPRDYLTDHALDAAYVGAGSAFGGVLPLLMAGPAIVTSVHTSMELARRPGIGPAGRLLALPPWEPLSLAGHVLLAVGLGEITGAALARRRFRWASALRWSGAGVLVVTAAVALKWANAPWWSALY